MAIVSETRIVYEDSTAFLWLFLGRGATVIQGDTQIYRERHW
jgi:hypothetical protein